MLMDVTKTPKPVELTEDEIKTALKVLEYLVENPDVHQATPDIKKLRFHATRWISPNWKRDKQKEKRLKAVEKDKQALNHAGIRKERLKKKQVQEIWNSLVRSNETLLTSKTSEEMLIEETKAKDQSSMVIIEDAPDEATMESSTTTTSTTMDASLSACTNSETTTTETPSVSTTESTSSPDQTSDPTPISAIKITTSLTCYVCKIDTHVIHPFYDQMCLPCGNLNHAKRLQTADLTNKIALVTGARVKIGYEVALKLLRAKAFVVVTTRFPKDAALRYSREKDFDEWKNRLHVYPLDMRFLHHVEEFIRLFKAKYKRLDILINNACQTIRRPPIFYKHLIAAEKFSDTIPLLEPLLPKFDITGENKRISAAEQPEDTSMVIPEVGGLTKMNLSSAELTQIPLTEEDLNTDLSLFPPNSFDADGQQVDLRTNNTWSTKLHSVTTVELAEVHLVNAMAPFLLISQFKPIMSQPSYIINVSSMEGKFSRNKTTNHPHTNMAKAALNMITRTSGRDYAESEIFMNSVDTGWITYENPCELTAKKLELGLDPPIDEIDGAARILDPIFTAMKTGENVWGIVFKDYKPDKW